MGVDPTTVDLVIDLRDVDFMKLGATSVAVASAGDLRRRPTYSDYVIAHPDPVEDQSGPAINMTASLRYSTEDTVLIVKGVRVRENGSALFPDLLRQLVARPEFAGQAFSRGDGWIEAAAKRDVGPGNAQKWREAGTSHHLTMITRLFATAAAL